MLVQVRPSWRWLGVLQGGWSYATLGGGELTVDPDGRPLALKTAEKPAGSVGEEAALAPAVAALAQAAAATEAAAAAATTNGASGPAGGGEGGEALSAGGGGPRTFQCVESLQLGGA